jgi:O-antigen/teichoic acid export membrane protein
MLKNYIARYFSEGHSRTVKAKKNIFGLFVLRTISISVNFLLVPLTLNYLNPTRYGIWLTLTSLVIWINVLDVGLGTGLRNKFAEAIAKNDDELARSYVSTSYAFITLVAIAAIIIFWLINPILDWSKILNTPPDMGHELSLLAGIVFTFFCFRLVFGLIGTILLADQRPAMNSSLELMTNIFSLFVIYIMTKSFESSLFWLGFVISFFIAVVPLIANIFLFKGKYKKYRPSFRYVKTNYVKELMSLGIQFFILQMAGVIVYSSSNIIITQLFGPSEVTPFNIAFKYYSVASMTFLMILTPFWSAYTDAYVKGDKEWIVRANKKLKTFWLLLAIVVVMMTAFANFAYSVWVGKNVRVPFSLSVSMAAYVLIFAWGNIFAYFINGAGKLRLQLWVAVTAGFLNIPLSVLLAKNFGLGIAGVTLATSIVLLPGCFLWPIQMKKLLLGSASGVWIK